MHVFNGLNQKGSRLLRTVLAASLLQLGSLSSAHADFMNGNFEDTYDTTVPLSNITYNTINGWTLQGYTFLGSFVTLPTSLTDINLKPSPPGPNNTLDGISDIIEGDTQTLFDYFLLGAKTNPLSGNVEQKLPIEGHQAAALNVRWFHTPYAKSGTSKINNWISVGRQATSISQTIAITPADFDPYDHKVHIRFKAAPVLENPNHKPSEQPFIAIQLNNLSTGRTASNPLFFMWNYAGQPGVPWTTLKKAGTNPGSNTSYEFTDWQAFDIAPGNAFIKESDSIELVVLASGCSPSGHDGHLYLDAVSTQITKGLWVVVTGPTTATPGDNITYTYTYYNVGTTAVDNVVVNAYMPQPQYAATPGSTTFVSVPQSPTVGTDSYCTGTDPVACSIGTLQPGAIGQFQITVNIPASWPIAAGPVNNGTYPISGDSADTVNGPLWQTDLVAPPAQSYLIADASGLTPTELIVGASFTGSFSCSNTPTPTSHDNAINAACGVTGLPPTLSVGPCTITPISTTWNQGDTIPLNQTVTCFVTGTVTTVGDYPVTVTTTADNNTSPPANVDDTLLIVKELPQVVVTPIGDGFETITPFDPVIIPNGTSTNITAIAHDGFVLSPTVGGTCGGTLVNSTYTTATVTVDCTVIFRATPIITGDFEGDTVHACCGRPVLLNPLRITGNNPTVFSVTATTGDAYCVIGQSGSQSYVKAFGSNGTCTIVGTKNGITSLPLTVIV